MDANPQHLNAIEIDDRFIGDWIEYGMAEITPYLAKHLRFARWCDEHDSGETGRQLTTGSESLRVLRSGRTMPPRSRRRPRGTARRPARPAAPCEHLAVGVDEAGVAPAGDAEVGVARLARAVHGAAHHRDLEHLVVAGQPLPRPRSARSSTSTFVRPHDGQAIITGPLWRRPSDAQHLPGDLDLLDRVGGQRDAHRVADAHRSSSVPMPIELLTVPVNTGPASVTPRCSG